MRMIDADYLLKEFADRARAARNWKECALNNDNKEIAIRADAILSFLTEVKLTIDNAPTITPDMALFLAYESGKASAEAKTITPGGRYNGKRALSLLSEIETIARDAFNNPETLDINLYRAQALARIFQLFEYNNEEAADNGEQGSN